MLSDYQYAVLAQMGITVFTDNQHTESESKSESEFKSSNKPVSTSDAKSKISALRSSIGKSAAEKSPTETENKAAEPVENVRQQITNPDLAMVKDVLHVAEQLGMSLIPAEKWNVDDTGLLKVSSDTMILPAQPESFSAQQKRQLWKALVSASSA